MQFRRTGRLPSPLCFCARAGLVCVVLACAGFMAAVEPPVAVTIVVVGDIMLSRNVAAKMAEAGDPLLPFRHVSALLDSSGFNFGNLECPLAPPGEGTVARGGPGNRQSDWDGVIGGKSLVFAAPNKSVQALNRYNFRVVSMANNHALDQREAGLTHTLARLSANGIEVVGAGADLEQAWQNRTVEIEGRKIAFLAASYASWNYNDETNDYVARIENLDRLTSRVRALKTQADCIIVSMHAGDEYTAEPRPAQVKFAHAAIDAGADVVVGSHPHWIQPFERYKQGLIFYSLGNFVFDLDASPATREGAAVKLFINADGVHAAEIHPIEIEDSCCPRPGRPDEITSVLRRMHLASTRIPLTGVHRLASRR